MSALINSSKTNVIFVINGVILDSTPHPNSLFETCTSAALGRVITNCVALQWLTLASPDVEERSVAAKIRTRSSSYQY